MCSLDSEKVVCNQPKSLAMDGGSHDTMQTLPNGPSQRNGYTLDAQQDMEEETMPPSRELPGGFDAASRRCKGKQPIGPSECVPNSSHFSASLIFISVQTSSLIIFARYQ
jgi:hypothetical protein